MASAVAEVMVTVVPKAIAPATGLKVGVACGVPAFIVTFPLVTAVPVAGAKVNVPVAAVPIKVSPRLVRLATPELKSPALFNVLVPESPKMVPLKEVLTVILLAEALKLLTVLP